MRSTDRCSRVLSVGLVELGPDVDAFMGGVILGLGAFFVVMSALGGLALFRKILGS